MDEDRLSPQLGRLIDRAKVAALQARSRAVRAEGVALLTDRQAVYSGHAGGDPSHPQASAAEIALDAARGAGDEHIAAAAIAVADDPAQTLYPGSESHRCLAGLNPDLPVVVKQRGRWVLLILSQLDSPE